MADEKKKGFIAEFKEFIARGNVVDMAVGVIVGAAFKAIVDSLVNDILMPIIGGITGGMDFSSFMFTIGTAEIKYGLFIQNIINFLIVAFVIFLFVKAMNRISNIGKKEKAEEKAE